MKIVLLAGGLGKRLRKAVRDIPKPMAPISGKPFLEWLINRLKSQGFYDYIILTGYKADVIEDYFRDGGKFGVNIEYSREHRPLGTAGALFNAWEKLPDEFILINADTFFDIEIRLFVKYSSPPSMALRYTDDVKRYGFVEIDDDYNVVSFVEKGKLPEDRVDGYINGGIYYLSKESLERYRNIEKEQISLELDVLPRMIKDGILKGMPMGGKFIDIGVPEAYKRAQRLIPDWIRKQKKTAVFLDRDGVIVEDTGYVFGKNLSFIEKTFNIVEKANENNQWVIVVTNQAGVARGFYTERDVIETNLYIKRVYEERGLRIDAFYYCPYHVEGVIEKYKKKALCRKPEPGMVLKAAEDFPIAFEGSKMIGDKETDRIKLPYIEFEQFRID